MSRTLTVFACSTLFLLFLLIACCHDAPQGVTHSGRFVVFPKNAANFGYDTSDTLYSGTPQNMIVTLTLYPEFGERSSVFLTANGNDIAELKQADEDSRTFKLDKVKTLSVRFGAPGSPTSASPQVGGDYTISMILK